MSAPPPNRLLARMRAGEADYLYSLGNFASARHVDYACGTGLFHTLWFNLEHFDIPTQELAVLNMVAQAYPMTSLARFKAADYQSVLRVLETGVGAIMAAMVESAEEARQIVRWSRCNAPATGLGGVTGMGGWSSGSADAGCGTAPAADPMHLQNTGVAVICQIETPEAVAALDAIVAVPGVDGLFFGPGDYAHRIGRVGQIAHPGVISAMEQVAAACRRQGKFWGTVSMGRDHYRQVRSLGAQLIGVGGDVRVMRFGMRELAKTFGEE